MSAVEQLETERDDLRKELRGTHEMLAQVLMAVGHPVQVTKEQLAKGLGDGTQIRIDDDLQTESFIFYVETPE